MQGEWKIGYKDTRGYEAEGRLGRYIGEKQWLYPLHRGGLDLPQGEAGERNMFRQTTKRTGKWTAPWAPGTRCPCS